MRSFSPKMPPQPGMMQTCAARPLNFSATVADLSGIAGTLRRKLARRRTAETEFAMHGGERGLHVLFIDDERNIRFGGTLSDRDDVDILAAERAERASGNARSAAHVFADDGDDGDVRIRGDVLHLFVFHVLGKFFP